MITGIDISHHNYFNSPLNKINLDNNFVIMKATEGGTYRDNKLINYMNKIIGNIHNPMIGFYHFAKASTENSWQIESTNFLEYTDRFKSNILHPIYALDVEADAVRKPYIDAWAANWCAVVEAATGVKPLIYISASECKKFKSVQAAGCGLWVAKWSKNKPTVKQIAPWKFYAIWQNAVKDNLDRDIFNGSRKAWFKYAGLTDAEAAKL